MSYRISHLLFPLALLVGVGAWPACSVDVDGYEFEEESSGDGDGDGGGDGDGDGGGDGDGDGDGRVLQRARERAQGEWSTRCIEGADELDAGFQYVYSLDGRKLRLDMFAYLSDCSLQLWVQSIEANFVLQSEHIIEDSYVLRLEITNRQIMLLEPEAAVVANDEGLFGIMDWEHGVWFNLLGVGDGQGMVLEEDDMAFVAIWFQSEEEEFRASLITVGAVPAEVLEEPFQRSDGQSANEL